MSISSQQYCGRGPLYIFLEIRKGDIVKIFDDACLSTRICIHWHRYSNVYLNIDSYIPGFHSFVIES